MSSGRDALGNISIEVSRVAVEVFVWTELRRIDEDGNGDERSMFSSFGDEGLVTSMQRAHRWNDRHSVTSTTRFVTSKSKRVG